MAISTGDGALSRPWKRRRVSLALTVVVALAITGVSAVQSHAAQRSRGYAWAAGLPGCDAKRPAIAHRSPTQILSPQPTDGPVPCGALTGWPTIENRVEVTNAGTVVYMPALLPATDPAVLGGCGHVPGICGSNTVARTTDGGATWATSTAQAHPDGLVFSGDVDNNVYVDHSTGRFFYYDYDSGTVGAQPHICGNGEGATIFFSDDDGVTWSHGSDLDHSCSENPTLLVGKATVSAPSYAGGVVYLCGNNFGTGIAGTGSTAKVCSKSIDGGKTWVGDLLQGGGGQGDYSGRLKDSSNAPYVECAGQSSSAPNDVQPLPDGTLVVIVTCNAKTFLSRSADEGKSWNIQNEIPSDGALRADSHGNLYKLRETFLSTSTNGGATWSVEHDMLAPGVVSRGTTFFAQGTHAADHEVGRVAVMYYGILEGNTTSDGFITETRNALDANPIFWSGQVNQPDRPLLYNTTGANLGVTVLDFIGGAFSPDGRSVWASFVQDCGTGPADPNCASRYPGINPADPQDGFAGRLVWPPKYRHKG